MENLNEIKNLLDPALVQVDLLQTLLNFAVCLIMSFVLRYFYMSRSFTLTGTAQTASILPILSAVVFLVIVVVKSSLALSLGLVGALSIVRFRTPIKEPEELVYLFLAIAIGLGYGAGHTLLTTILVMIILLVISLWLSNKNSISDEYNLVINWTKEDLNFKQISGALDFSVDEMSLIRLERGEKSNTAVILIAPKTQVDIDKITLDLKQLDNKVSLTFFESKTNW